MLASSIDFEVEFKPLTFVDRCQARTLDRADMHERIRLTIVTNEKAETLHRVEEFDRPCRPFTGQFTLGCASAFLNSDDFADDLKILSGNLAATIDQVEFKLLPFGQTFEPGAFNGTDVDEHVLTAAFLSDKAETFLAVEELHRAFAGAYDLSGHAVETAAATTAAAGATTTAAAAEAITTASAAAIAIAATTTAAVAITATAAEAVSAAIISVIRRGRESVTAATERIKAVLAESVALILAAATSSIVTHNLIRTLSRCPPSDALAAWTACRARRRCEPPESAHTS